MFSFLVRVPNPPIPLAVLSHLVVDVFQGVHQEELRENRLIIF